LKGSAPALPYTEDVAHIHIPPRGTGESLHVSVELCLESWPEPPGVSLEGAEKKDHSMIPAKAKAPTVQMQNPGSFPCRD